MEDSAVIAENDNEITLPLNVTTLTTLANGKITHSTVAINSLMDSHYSCSNADKSQLSLKFYQSVIIRTY